MSVPAAHISCCNLQLSIHHLQEDSSRLRRELPYSISFHRKARLVCLAYVLGENRDMRIRSLIVSLEAEMNLTGY